MKRYTVTIEAIGALPRMIVKGTRYTTALNGALVIYDETGIVAEVSAARWVCILVEDVTEDETP